MNTGKKIVSAAMFLALMALTFYVIFKNQDITEVMEAIKQMDKGYLTLAVGIALFFVSAEGILFWYLYRSVGEKANFLSCIKYAFVGFFFCGITPSASGGQPMQLYYMRKDGRSTANSTVALLSAAAAYKLVLVLMGLGICLFWWNPLKGYLEGFLPLYILGIFLNAGLVAVLLIIILNASGLERFLCAAERFLVKIRLMKPSEKRRESIHDMVTQYQETVTFLKTHLKVVAFLLIITFIQRCSVFGLTWLIYKGMGLAGTDAFTIMALQAVVYISVDMLPLPGSQGITEIMYAAVFNKIFLGNTLTISMCVTRGINFYMLIIISAVVAAYCWWSAGRKKKKLQQER